MKELDLLVQKDADLKRATDHVTTLMEKIANLNIALGSKDELIRSKEAEIKRIEDESKKSEKVIVKTYAIADSNGRTKCPHCGKSDYTDYKNNCGHCGKDKVTTTYSNFKAEESAMRSEIEAKLKKSLSEAENTQLDLEIQADELKKKIERVNKSISVDNTEWEEKTRKKYLKVVEAYDDEIKELKDEIVKVKKNKLDDELETQREDDLMTLKTTIERLTKEIEEPVRTGNWFYRLISTFVDTSAKKQAIKELQEAKELANKVEYRNIHKEDYRSETIAETRRRKAKEEHERVLRNKPNTNYTYTYGTVSSDMYSPYAYMN
jgi:ribosomal protein L37E